METNTTTHGDEMKTSRYANSFIAEFAFLAEFAAAGADRVEPMADGCDVHIGPDVFHVTSMIDDAGECCGFIWEDFSHSTPLGLTAEAATDALLSLDKWWRRESWLR